MNYQFTTYDRKANELKFDMTEAQYKLMRETFADEKLTIEENIKITELKEEQVKEIKCSKNPIKSFRNII